MEDSVRGTHTTLTTSRISAASSISSLSADSIEHIQGSASEFTAPEVRIQDDGTVNGVVIGLLSSFGSAVLIALIFLLVYFFKYTNNGRILLDRMGRPGEYDDEQAFAREEAEALEEMDDLQRTEYLRAKGMSLPYIHLFSSRIAETDANFPLRSIYTGKPTRLITNRHFIITISSDSRKRRISVGI